MKVVITGGGGFLGQVLAKEILTGKQLRSETSMQTITELILADICEPKEYLFDLHSLAKLNDIKLRVEVGDVSEIEYCKSIIGTPTNENDHALSVFHLGAVMSGAPPDLALNVNLYGTMHMLEATRAWQEASSSKSSSGATRPTFIFSSAGATLGAGHEADWVQKDDTISDATRAAPHTTYGTTKACAELLLADYSRRGFVDGRGVRLPSVVVRAGAPNAATTSCFSSVIREPLSGKDAKVPIGPNVFHAVTGYRAAIGGVISVHNAMPEIVDKLLGFDRTVFLPTRSVSLRQLEEAMKRVVSLESVSMLGNVVYEEDKKLSSIVGSFPTKVDSTRALKLGAPPTPTIDDMIREYCEDFQSALAEGVVVMDETKDDLPAFQPNVNRVVALITGGGSGIGRHVAVRLSQGGWGGIDGKGHDVDGNLLKVSLVLVGRRSEPLETTKKMCQESSETEIDILAMPTDVTNENDVKNLMNSINTHFGRVDLLFNNAGINIAPSPVENIDSNDFQKVIDTSKQFL